MLILHFYKTLEQFHRQKTLVQFSVVILDILLYMLTAKIKLQQNKVHIES